MDIRLARTTDAPGCLDIYRPIVAETPISFETELPEVGDFSVRMQDNLQFAPWLVATEGKTILGYAYGSRFRPRPAYQWSAEVTVYTAERARKRGIGSALYTILLKAMRIQGFVNAYALITLPNPGSVVLHENLGFQKLGVLENIGFKLDVWHDVGWWGLALQNAKDSPRPLGSVNDATAAALA